MPCGTRADLAAHCNVNKSTVTRWDQKNLVVWTSDGLIDIDQTVDRVSKAADPSKHGVALRHQRERQEKLVEQLVFGESAPLDPPRPDELPRGVQGGEVDESYASFNKSRALKEAENARLLKLKREEQEGLLVRVEDVERAGESEAAIVKRAFSSLPARVIPLLSAEADPAKQYAILENQLDIILDEMCLHIDSLLENKNA